MTRARHWAVLAHGAGSTADFIDRALPARELGVDAVRCWDDRTGDVSSMAARLAVEVRALRAGGDVVAVVGGVSLGAHAAAWWALANGSLEAGGDSAGESVTLLLVMPAWTGPASEVAAVTAQTAAAVRKDGMRHLLAALQASAPAPVDADAGNAPAWVAAELARAWPTYGDAALATALQTASTGAAPDAQALGRITLPAVVVGLRDDPLHPLAIAEQWAATVPTARLVTLDKAEPARAVRMLGVAAGAELRALSESR